MTKSPKLSNTLPDSLTKTPEELNGGSKKIDGVIGEQVGLVDGLMDITLKISDKLIIGKIISGCEILELLEEETLPNGKKVRKAIVRKKKGVKLYRYITEDYKIYEVEGEEISTIFKNKKLFLNGEEIEIRKCNTESGDKYITNEDKFFRIEGNIVRRLIYDDKGTITHINIIDKENDKNKTYEVKNGKMKRNKKEEIKKLFKKLFEKKEKIK
ncbi:MAG: hypothetical protein WC850_00820 [Candidatus Gracilibacteria bacterium]